MFEPSFEKIQAELREYCRRMDPAYAHVKIQTIRGDDGTSHLEIRDNSYHYIATERGLILSEKQTSNKNELLYWLVDEIAWSKACAYEFKHRVKGQSFRRLLFAKNIEYLMMVKPAWAERKQKEFEAILAKHPYDDAAEG